MKRKTIVMTLEWALAVLLVFLFFSDGPFTIGSGSAAEAHERSERSYHYGPSQTIKEIQYRNDIVIFLSTYKNWFSADTSVKKGWRWFPGGGVGGVEIDKSKAVSYSWEISRYKKERWIAKFYGYVSDPRITSVVLNMDVINEGKQTDSKDDTQKMTVLKQSITEDRMFLFLWNEAEIRYTWKSLQGLDSEGNVLYEQTLN
ncbi:hypothetical protein [Cohnella mopanensis]|uniref:hypothetical protein n=1 Tax=Cohnella mopanensis TaxID=2911966 RepID=UPI001EF83137|nr:hypothetical protein [Cohnella mopanensis]